MTRRQAILFIASYISLIALSVWFNVSVLCLADAKYDHGCGGLSVYIPLWEMFLAPLAVAALILERWRRTEAPGSSVIVTYLVAILIVYQIGSRLERFPVLIAVEAAVIGLAAVLRFRRSARRRDIDASG